jgi:hypothetical protein
MFIGFIKFRITINRRLPQEQETFHVPGCGRLTALSSANIQIAVGLLNNEEVQYRVFDFRCSPQCGRDLYTLGCYAALSGR